ncbi:hypothetical protein RJ641_014490, partial [Dillenia turbinata]
TGAFLAMAMLGKIDQNLAPKGISITIAPLGAVCAVLFATPSSPAARVLSLSLIYEIPDTMCSWLKLDVQPWELWHFLSMGVVAFSLFGPGWLARSTALAASIAFMIYTAASLPILFIDAAKLHRLNFWYALFPGATGCILLCLIVSLLAIKPSLFLPVLLPSNMLS